MPGRPIYRWPRRLRPRERAVDEGLSALTDSELLALVIGKGTKAKSAVGLGEELLKHFGSLANISKRSPRELCVVEGIGTAKATAILAAFEMGRRATAREENVVIIKGPDDVYSYMRPYISHMRKESFWVLLLTARGKVLRRVKVSEGSLTSTVVHPREVFREALVESAASIILVHNHPSGDPSPSDDDIKITNRLVQAGEVFSIPVVDHVIVCDGCYLSFKDKGYIP